MAGLTDGFLPAFLDPVFEYLSATLPPPLYSFLVNVLSHSFAAVTAIARLSASLISKNTSDWNAQTILPPVITILAAYLALASLYRTTTWAIRLAFWFLKWGTLIGVIMAGAGYFMGTAGDAVGNHGAAVLGDVFSSLFDGRPSKQNRQANSQRRSKNKPKPWDSFEHRREWQYQEANDRQNANPQAQKVFDMVVDAAGQVLGAGGWWNVIKNVGKEPTVSEDGEKESKRQTKKKGRSGNSRSR